MRFGFFFLIAVVGATALAARTQSCPESRMPVRRTVPDTRSATPAGAVVPAADSSPAAPVPPAPARISASPAPAFAAVSGGTSGVEGPQALLGVLVRLLSLTPLQKAQIEEILWERTKQVGEYEQEVARRGWAKLSDFESRTTEIRDLAHRRVMALLTSAQAEEYRRAMAAGIPEDSLSIELPENVVQLD